MKLIRGIHNLSKAPYGCVLTIGNFDGVHRGHQALLQKLYKEGQKRNLPVVVIIFEPQPLELFAGIKAPARLTNLREKLHYLSHYGVDYLLCIRFNHYFAALTAQNFITNFLVKHLGVRFLIVGSDFHFGAGRKGNFSLLQEAGSKYGFDVIITKTLYENSIRISSTAIRKALAEDNLHIAENFLGYPFVISGRVIHGDELGRTIGFPTANILLQRQVSPIEGVYAVEVKGLNNQSIFGIANIGTCPTLPGKKQQLEVHLFDIEMNLYGRHLSVIFRKKIRNERKFFSLNELKTQILQDKLIANKFFNLLK